MRALLLFGLLASTPFGTAQTSSQFTTPDGKLHTHIEGIDIPSVANAPFAAREVVTWDQALAGGGTISHTYYTLVARDSQGRVRREMRDFVPAGSNEIPRLRSFGIADPVNATHTICSPDAMKCTVAAYHPRAVLTEAASGPLPSGTGTLHRESLGQQTVSSITVVGTRETVTTDVGTHGNDRPLVSSKDLWYSPDLQTNLSVIRNDPQFGRQTLTLTDIQRGEPDQSYFTIPPGYGIIDTRNNSASK
jgi:hypothetical protein